MSLEQVVTSVRDLWQWGVKKLLPRRKTGIAKCRTNGVLVLPEYLAMWQNNPEQTAITRSCELMKEIDSMGLLTRSGRPFLPSNI